MNAITYNKDYKKTKKSTLLVGKALDNYDFMLLYEK